MSKYQMQDMDCIARRDVFLPVQTGHCSNIKIYISVVARDGYRWEFGINSRAFCRHIPILSVIGPETLVKVRPYRGNIDA